MSAFQVSPEHLGALVRFALLDHRQVRFYSPLTSEDPADLIRCLAEECYKSVRHRYPTGDLPGPCSFAYGPVEAHDRLEEYRALSPVEAIKACECYEYQSCEHPGWEGSTARTVIERIKGKAISCLPGYNEASWEISETAAEYAERTGTCERRSIFS